MLYVVGGADENEVLLYNALLALRDSLNILLKYVMRPAALSTENRRKKRSLGNLVRLCYVVLTVAQGIYGQANHYRKLRSRVSCH